METMEGGIIEQIAVTKGGVARTACGSFPGIYTRLDDPEVFRWMQSVIFGIVPTTTSIPEPCGILRRDGQVSFFFKYKGYKCLNFVFSVAMDGNYQKK